MTANRKKLPPFQYFCFFFFKSSIGITPPPRRQRLRRCRGRGALRVPAARVGGKVGGFPVNDCMYVIFLLIHT